MIQHIGDEFEGIVSSVANFGMFIELPNTIEGMVHISNMTDDYYQFDERQMALIGERQKSIPYWRSSYSESHTCRCR